MIYDYGLLRHAELGLLTKVLCSELLCCAEPGRLVLGCGAAEGLCAGDPLGRTQKWILLTGSACN